MLMISKSTHLCLNKQKLKFKVNIFTSPNKPVTTVTTSKSIFGNKFMFCFFLYTVAWLFVLCFLIWRLRCS